MSITCNVLNSTGSPAQYIYSRPSYHTSDTVKLYETNSVLVSRLAMKTTLVLEICIARIRLIRDQQHTSTFTEAGSDTSKKKVLVHFNHAPKGSCLGLPKRKFGVLKSVQLGSVCVQRHCTQIHQKQITCAQLLVKVKYH